MSRDKKLLKSRAEGAQPAFCTDVRATVAGRLAALTKKRPALAEWLKQCRARKGGCPLYDQINELTRTRR